MIVTLAYGKQGLDVELPEDLAVTVVEPRFVPGLVWPAEAIREALAAPIGGPTLAEYVAGARRIGVVFSDITRPTPNHVLIPTVLEALRGCSSAEIILFNALGTHRPNTDAELRTMLGDEVVGSYRIVQNDAFDRSTQAHLGRSARGHDIWLNREVLACDARILTGFIEPHFFAGFSGGGKALMPGMAGQETVLGNHDAGMIAHPRATYGVTDGNPILDEIREVAARAGSSFLCNVTLNKHKEITGVFAGDLAEAHACGCDFVRDTAMQPVDGRFDIVVTSNSGYPLDLNLYQAVKGMAAAAQVVKPGGAIIVAAECWDGIPEHGMFGQLLRSAPDPAALLDRIMAPGFLAQDQWQAQIQAQIQQVAEVYVYSDHLSDGDITAALLRPCRDIGRTVRELAARYGPDTRICVLPEGPQTVPFIPE